jgi:hypothetical protein
LDFPANKKIASFQRRPSIAWSTSAMIFDVAKKENSRLSLCCVGQDMNEHHFGNACASVRIHSNPNQREVMAQPQPQDRLP